MTLDDFDYDLPRELIAQVPTPERTGSRLLRLDARSGALNDLVFGDIEGLVSPADVLVVNDTRVLKARLFGRKQTGGHVEVFVERVLGRDEVLAQVRASHSPREGATLAIGGVEATVVERRGPFFRLRFEDCADVFALLERHGSVPLPPYIDHVPEAADEARYQTVYARAAGAVAAPTAGLHFDAPLLARLRARGVAVASVTLHVGAGTFQPVRESDLAAHEMHSEWYTIAESTVATVAAARERGGRVVAVGTTTLRALESAAAAGNGAQFANAADGAAFLRAGAGETRLFILPGYRFRIVDALITNFHLPRSTLLMLVSAFGGSDNIRRAYRHAIEKRYRFYSYGDAMLIERDVA